MSRKSAVVIGHGMVGHRFVEALRARDESDDWSVTVLCEEPLPAYDRVGLSSYVGRGTPRSLRSRVTTTRTTLSSISGSAAGPRPSIGSPARSPPIRVRSSRTTLS